LKCAGGVFTECWTLASSIQDLDQKNNAPLDVNKCRDVIFPSRGASNIGQAPVLTMQESSTL